MKWTYMLKWGLGFLVVLVLIFLHLQFDFIPKEILLFVGMFLIVAMLKFPKRMKNRRPTWKH